MPRIVAKTFKQSGIKMGVMEKPIITTEPQKPKTVKLDLAKTIGHNEVKGEKESKFKRKEYMEKKRNTDPLKVKQMMPEKIKFKVGAKAKSKEKDKKPSEKDMTIKFTFITEDFLKGCQQQAEEKLNHLRLTLPDTGPATTLDPIANENGKKAEEEFNSRLNMFTGKIKSPINVPRWEVSASTNRRNTINYPTRSHKIATSLVERLHNNLLDKGFKYKPLAYMASGYKKDNVEVVVSARKDDVSISLFK